MRASGIGIHGQKRDVAQSIPCLFLNFTCYCLRECLFLLYITSNESPFSTFQKAWRSFDQENLVVVQNQSIDNDVSEIGF